MPCIAAQSCAGHAPRATRHPCPPSAPTPNARLPHLQEFDRRKKDEMLNLAQSCRRIATHRATLEKKAIRQCAAPCCGLRFCAVLRCTGVPRHAGAGGHMLHDVSASALCRCHGAAPCCAVLCGAAAAAPARGWLNLRKHPRAVPRPLPAAWFATHLAAAAACEGGARATRARPAFWALRALCRSQRGSNLAP